jgi:hypothetical protein
MCCGTLLHVAERTRGRVTQEFLLNKETDTDKEERAIGFQPLERSIGQLKKIR